MRKWVIIFARTALEPLADGQRIPKLNRIDDIIRDFSIYSSSYQTNMVRFRGVNSGPRNHLIDPPPNYEESYVPILTISANSVWSCNIKFLARLAIPAVLGIRV